MEQWIENLRTLKQEKKVTYEWIAEQSGQPERTVIRIFAGETDDPKCKTLKPICYALGVTLDEVLTDTTTFLSTKRLSALKEEAGQLLAENDRLTAEVERLSGELALANAENVILKDKLTCTENQLKDTKLVLQEQIIEIHRYYMDKNK